VTTHDPKREVEKLRDHLASHDKPLALLIGAGASVAVRDENGAGLIPAIAALGQICADRVGALGDEYATAYGAIAAEQDALLDRDVTIEDVLSSVRSKVSAMGTGDHLAGATKAQLEAIELEIRKTIAAIARPDEARIPARLPHHSLARWIGRIDRKVPVELFTTNYDTLLERALEDERVPVFDGFVGSRRPFFSAASLQHAESAPGRRWTRLWKVHGSINWARATSSDGLPRIVRTQEHQGGELIFPSLHKYDESRKQPYVAMLEHLGRVLNRREETILLTVGYSFGDQHINEVLFDALDARERTHVISLQFAELPDDHDVIERAQRRRNLLICGPETAVVGGVRAPWRLAEAVDERTADLLDVPFDSDAAPDVDDPAVTGRFRLGNFKWLGRFLDGIAGADA
jgi:uncharacterized protein YciI